MGGLDQQFLLFEADPTVINTPNHEMPIIVDGRGTVAELDGDGNPVVRNRRFKVPNDAGVGTPRRNTQLNKPVTVAEWNKAEGYAQLRCKPDGTGSVRVIASGLIPQGVYTAWEVVAINSADYDPTDPTAPPPIAGTAFGGVPNTIIPDRFGRAVYDRDLNYCPLDTGERPLMYIALLYHSDAMVYGAYFDQGQLDPGAALPIGTVSADHVCIPVGNALTPPRGEGEGEARDG